MGPVIDQLLRLVWFFVTLSVSPFSVFLFALILFRLGTMSMNLLDTISQHIREKKA